MNKMHNLGTVMRFEIVRTLKKKSFWLMALSFPVIMGIIFAIVFFSASATDKATEELKNQKFSIAVTDDSKLINQQLLAALKVRQDLDKPSAIDEVKSGKLDAYFFFPSDISKQKVELYAQDVGMFQNSRYEAVASMLLNQSVDQQISPQQKTILQNKIKTGLTTYRDGKVYDSIKELIAPGIFLLLFYSLIAFFGGQMLTSTIEEKENRVIEMLLTTIKAEALITGKILSLVILALIQSALILIPIIIIYLAFGSQLQLPDIDLTNIPVNPARVSIGAAIFTFSFLLFTGILVAIGAMMPTAKEASSWFGVVMIFLFVPLYGASALISYPDSLFVHFLSLFPLTSPIPLMLRNAVGNLPLWEALTGIGILIVATVIIMLLAVKIFRYGVMEYNGRLSLKVLRSSRRSDS
ncbi:sodium transporter [Candidatus Saccharibacteria bacterium]|nr:MAG: sodium transporter [Candidatus Saccharibacteria bacterium]